VGAASARVEAGLALQADVADSGGGAGGAGGAAEALAEGACQAVGAGGRGKDGGVRGRQPGCRPSLELVLRRPLQGSNTLRALSAESAAAPMSSPPNSSSCHHPNPPSHLPAGHRPQIL